MAKHKKCVKPRVYVILIVLILLLTVPFITAMGIKFDRQQEDIAARQAALDEKQAKVDDLARQYEFYSTDEGIERLARELGYIYEGETLYRRK